MAPNFSLVKERQILKRVFRIMTTFLHLKIFVVLFNLLLVGVKSDFQRHVLRNKLKLWFN